MSEGKNGYIKSHIKAYIYRVDLYDNPCYLGATVDLPATSDYIQDALDMARISPDDEYKFTEFMWNQHCFEGEILKGAKIEELNFLAWRLAQMDEHYGLMYEACLKLKEKDLTLKDMINLTYVLDNCHVGYHINNDEDLGRFAAEGDFIKEIVNLPDEAWEFIDFKKAGEQMRKAEKGIFIDGFYVACDIENINEVYDGITLPKSNFGENGIFNILIAKAPEGSDTTEDRARWLYLPASDKQLSGFLRTIEAKSFEDCVYYEFSTSVLQVENLFYDLAQLEQLNTLAKCISNQELRKCKAVLEYMECESLEQAIDYCENLQCFDFYPDMICAKDYGRHIYKTKEAMPQALAMNINFESYGQNQMSEHGAKATSYGFIEKNDHPLILRHSESQNPKLESLEM